jgi:hypothetical protein
MANSFDYKYKRVLFDQVQVQITYEIGRWSSPRTPIFHINKIDLDDITAILLKGALSAKPKPYNIKDLL